MRLRDETVGAMNLFLAPGPGLPPADLELGQALSDVATIALISHRAMRANEQLAEQLQLALSSRVAIEQAKGVLAERAQVDMQAAFELLRSYARRNRRQLSEVAAAVAAGELSTSVFLSSEADNRRRRRARPKVLNWTHRVSVQDPGTPQTLARVPNPGFAIDGDGRGGPRVDE